MSAVGKLPLSPCPKPFLTALPSFSTASRSYCPGPLALSSPKESGSRSCPTCSAKPGALDRAPCSQNSAQGRSPMRRAALKGNALHPAIPGCLRTGTKHPEQPGSAEFPVPQRDREVCKGLTCSAEQAPGVVVLEDQRAAAPAKHAASPGTLQGERNTGARSDTSCGLCVLTWTLLWAISPGVGQFVASPKSPTLYPKRKVSLAHNLRVPFPGSAARSPSQTRCHCHHPPVSCKQLSPGGLGITPKLHKPLSPPT